MFRTFAYATILALTVTAASAADFREEQIHKAAEKACFVAGSDSLPLSFYGAMYRACVDRVTRVTLRRIDLLAQQKARATTASLAN